MMILTDCEKQHLVCLPLRPRKWFPRVGLILLVLIACWAGVLFIFDDQRRGINLPHHRDGENSIVEAFQSTKDHLIVATAGTADGKLMFAWDIREGTLDWARLYPDDTTLLGLSPDGSDVVYQTPDRTLHIANTRNGIDRKSHIFDRRVSFFMFSPSGQSVALGSWTKPLEVLDYRRWEVTRRFANTNNLRAINYTDDGRNILGVPYPKKELFVKLNIRNGQLRKIAGIPSDAGVVVSPDNRFIYYSGRFDGCIELYSGCKVWQDRSVASDSIASMACLETGRRLIIGSKYQLIVRDAIDGKPLAVHSRAHQGWIRQILPGEDSASVITAGDDGAMRAWDIDTLRELKSYQIRSADEHQVKWVTETREGVKVGITPIK